MLLSDKARNLVIEKYKNGNNHRLNHILGVAEMASFLAKKYNCDVEKALIASYMHDYSKYDDVSEIELVLSNEEIEECRKYPFLYHAYGSAYKYKEYFFDDFDADVFNAIYNHVFGRPDMSLLEAIVMISDYTEKNREYPSCIECRNILLSGKFNEAICYSLEKTIEIVKKDGKNPHPRQLIVYNQYLKKVGKKMTLEEVLLNDLAKVKAEDILVYDMKGKSPFYDQMILASVSSERQAQAIVSYVTEDTLKEGYKVRSIEGVNSPWVLIDCYDSILSVFTKEERQRFSLEKIYMDIPVKNINQ